MKLVNAKKTPIFFLNQSLNLLIYNEKRLVFCKIFRQGFG